MNMPLTKSTIRICSFMSIILISACSSHIPPEIKQSMDDAPSMAQIHDAPDSYLSKKVRWGGVILNTENKHNASWLTILAYPLSDHGEPLLSDQSPGRFIAIVEQFLEPLVYSQDRKITVTGKLLRTETIKVGEYPYEYPVIQVDQHYLWPFEPELSDFDHYPYWWSDPWYNPYYPWHSPYYPHRY